MRSLFVLMIFSGLSPLLAQADKPALPNPLAEARTRLLKGNYDEARSGFEQFLKDGTHGPAAAVGIARCWRATGEYDKAHKALDQALTQHAGHPVLLAERGDLFFSLGKWDEARDDATAAIAKKPDQFLARWVLARLLRDQGDTVGADQAVRWFVRTYTARSNADQDITDPEELLLVAYAGAENARWHNLTNQFRFILNEVLKDALTENPNYWPAEYYAGRMLLEKYNRPDALDAFDKVIKINPNAAEPYVGKAILALQRFEVKDAEALAEQALKINPKHVGALRIQADVRTMGGETAEALRLLESARAINPRDATTLGKLAACHFALRQMDQFQAIIIEAERYDSKPGQFYHDLAESLEDRRIYARAGEYYQKAAELRPMFSGPSTALGMLHLRLGKETEGRDILTKAFEADPFNVRVANSLKVLKHLDRYEVIETPHYIVKFDPMHDRLLGEFIAEYLEEIHTELRDQFQYEPPGKTLIEVFSTHEMFSGRTVGLPDLHTIGACTGRVVCMASPRAKGINKPFNWGRVMRHELTHVFNLAQTDFQCPHWLTEGLAVRMEKMNRPYSWTVTLRDRYLSDSLFTIDTVMLGFVRPRGPDEWLLAYCQSQLYVEYMTSRHGEGSVSKLLEAYRDGLSTEAALQRACGVDKVSFEKGYKEYIGKIVAPYLNTAQAKDDDDKPMTFAQLEEAHAKEPENASIAARLAEQYLRRGKPAQARKLADDVLKRDPANSTAALVKARLLSLAGDDDSARDVLVSAIEADPKNVRLLSAVARYYIEAKEYEKATELLERGRALAPLDGDWLEQLARLYKQTEQTDKLLIVLKELTAHDPDDLDSRLLLAKAALEAKKLEDADLYARDAIMIDVTNAEAQKLFLDVLKAQGKDEAHARYTERFNTGP